MYVVIVKPAKSDPEAVVAGRIIGSFDDCADEEIDAELAIGRV